MRLTGPIRLVAAVLATALAANNVALAAPPDPIKLHNYLTQRGIGKGLKIKETDGTLLTGNLAAIRNDSFDILPGGAAQPLTISYSQVSTVHYSNPPLPAGAKIAIWTVVVAVLVAIAVVLTKVGGPKGA